MFSMSKYIKSFSVYEQENQSNKLDHINEAKSYDVPEFGHLSVSGKKLKVEFYNLDDWDSSMYGGGKGHKQAMKDIKLAAAGSNDPLLDTIETHLDNSSLGKINWDKPIKLTDKGSAIEFVLESLVFEATVEMDAINPSDKDFLKFLKKNRVKIINKEMDGPGGGHPVITMQGKRKDLEKVLADPELGWDDPDLAEYIEESVVNEKIEVTKKMWDKDWALKGTKQGIEDNATKRENALLSVFKDPDDAAKWIESNYDDLPPQASHMELLEGLDEGAMSELHLLAKEAKDEKDFLKKAEEFVKSKGAKFNGLENMFKELYSDMKNESMNEGALAIGGGIILALLGLRLLKAIAKGILGRIGGSITVKPERLKEIVSKMVEDTVLIATKKGNIGGNDMLALVSWKKGIFDKIDSGEITRLKDLGAYVDKSDSIFESDKLNEGDDIKFKGKKVNVDSIEIEDIDRRDHPDYSDAYISYAEYTNGKKLTDIELEDFQDENWELINWLIFDKQLYM